MARRLKNACWVVPSGNDLLLFTSDGQLIPKQMRIRVTSDVDGFPTAIMTCVVNIAKDAQEMRAEIEALKEKKGIAV